MVEQGRDHDVAAADQPHRIVGSLAGQGLHFQHPRSGGVDQRAGHKDLVPGFDPPQIALALG